MRLALACTLIALVLASTSALAAELPTPTEQRTFPHLRLVGQSGDVVREGSPDRDSAFYRLRGPGKIVVEHLGRATYETGVPGTTLKFGGKWLMQGGVKVGSARIEVEGAFGMFAYRCACLDAVIITIDEGVIEVSGGTPRRITVLKGAATIDSHQHLPFGWRGPPWTVRLVAGQSVTWEPGRSAQVGGR